MFKIILVVPFMDFADGMALFPFILVRRPEYKTDKVLINHEMIHLRQQLETLILPFYLMYLVNYLFNIIKYKKHHPSYMNLYFEKEAYLNERNLDYLKERKMWDFRHYIFKHRL